jgi:site-specific DNA-cytosine methylase
MLTSVGLTSVGLFAGAGGLGMRLTRAGFRHHAVIEWNQWACDTIRRRKSPLRPIVSQCAHFIHDRALSRPIDRAGRWAAGDFRKCLETPERSWYVHALLDESPLQVGTV